MKTLKIGIAGYDQMKARTLAIASGEHPRARGEPRVWFTSIESFAKLLSEHNRRLLELIAREKAGFAHGARGAGRAKQIEPFANPEDDVAIRARGIAEGRARQGGAASALRPGEARCLVEGNEERIGWCQPVKLERIVRGARPC